MLSDEEWAAVREEARREMRTPAHQVVYWVRRGLAVRHAGVAREPGGELRGGPSPGEALADRRELGESG
jgi:hypothetical protein